MHSAVGRKTGITEEEYMSLLKLDRKDFKYREWVALTYAREWTFGKGRAVPDEYTLEFSRQYSQDEQALILKLLRLMLFANYCGNGYYKRPWRSGTAPQSCDVVSGMTGKNPE